MIEIKIDIDTESLRNLSKEFSMGITEAAFPNTTIAMQKAVQKISNGWKKYLNNEIELKGIRNLTSDEVSAKMIASIHERKNADLDYTVYSDSQEMKKFSSGTKPVDYDMKKTHPYGRKSRLSNDKIPYLIIPFRWGTPNEKGTKRAHFNNVIPQLEYKTMVKGLNISQRNRLKDYIEANYQGTPINRSGYDWGKKGRITEEMAWDSYSVGMVRMKNLTKSQYFTFRIISAKSPAGSWLYHRDGKPGLDIIGALQRTYENEVRQLVQDGIQADERELQL